MAIRPLDISDFDEFAPHQDPQPTLSWIPVDRLVIDDRYQRLIERSGRKNILHIANHFDWSKFSPVLVSRRPDDLYAIIDGQHRAHAAALRGIEAVPAMVSELSLEQEASAFAWVNGSVTALTPNQIFKAALAGFEPWAVQCDAVVSKAGCKLMTYNSSSNQKKPGEVYCIGSVRRFVEAGLGSFLVAALAGIKASPHSDRVHYYGAFGLNSLVPAAVQTGTTQSDVIAGFLSEFSLDEIARRVDQIKYEPEHNGKSATSLMADSTRVLLKKHLTQVARR